MDPSRESFWNIHFSWVMYALAAIAVAILVYAIYRYYRRWGLGGPADRGQHLGRRLWDFIIRAAVDGVMHRIFFGCPRKGLSPREFYPGLAHYLLFIGGIILLLGTALEAASHYVYHFNHGGFYLGYSLATDIGGLMTIVGAVMAIVRRYGTKPERLDTIWDDTVALGLVIALAATGFIVEGLRIAATELNVVSWAPWSPVGYALSLAFGGLSQGALLGAHVGTWWLHIVLSLGAVIYVALFNSKLLHIIWDPVNVFFRNLGPRGAIAPIDFETTEQFGASKIEDFTWKQLLGLDACTRCGRCQDVCPAYASGKALNPKKVIQDLKAHFAEVYPIPLLGMPKAAESRKDMVSEAVTEEVVWDCTTCRACMEVCPVYIEHIDKIIEIRRNLAMEQSRFPESAQDALKCLGTRGHPYRGTTATRTEWADDLGVKVFTEDSDVDVLYWVGCSGALEVRNQKVARAMARIMQAAGEKFAILGNEEQCCGDPARRMGDEYLFQTITEANVELFKNYGVKKIVTTCPHCFNTFKHEYPQMGGECEVIHHTQYLAGLISRGRIQLSTAGEQRLATYHDSCYLGRYNDVYAEPRQVLKAIPGVAGTELPRNREYSFCCGGGGGHMWMEEDADKRPSNRRIEEVLEAGADTVATACPFCLVMFEDALKAKGAEEIIKATDLAELVAASLEKTTPPPLEEGSHATTENPVDDGGPASTE
ncbi:heterodisulfide reductase-related iron-sulfur binding cluster [Chloroflexota bacterium]